MINKFAEEVLSCGATEVLPQNLSDEWLEKLYYGAVYFIKVVSMEDDGEIDMEHFSDMNSMLLFAADSEIYQSKNNYKADLEFTARSEEELYDNLTCLAMNYIFEMISRNSEITIDPPDLKNIYDMERLFKIEAKRPELTDLLDNILGDEDDNE